ncbi:MAG: efflux RND transporter periplasmic adaptor subunit [Candidatus Thiodiazotropha lotti]|uniref:Efflux RND transporter periplasmic adaptor subunit n=1 Tax=Candidatus Thiodiazotropha lotti TaxID=2792787 RepID=A0A9E4K6M6_9GAMM|nr:efflux RND transporter periplasmic adaptor subunit [Candidatus Thiodiazotropha lotti]MCG7920630.1 efflux RND transporter periplasmic adaptor subunit [Candidatus Thiodiazotropha lotti]MCG7930675.1 efflux RND transporter periplasmic adaptor subunit [Candidatus Thiodiazotropha lotti]MCG7940048.1 efflux RND transporter periplasmic adaptor subunit [Candidatus Thiodiazotropha lotti]MCG7988240.1 efflux RND transporter periplasmic adaptor subunit [Candidatus Thiodiazotropha lotti]
MRLLSILICLLGLLSVSSPVVANALVVARVAVQNEIQSGFTRAHSRVTLSAEESGRVESVNGDVGDRVDADSPFACLDDTYLKLELRTNQAEQQALQVDMAYYRKEVVRYSKLVKKNSSSESQLDSAQRNLDKTRNQLKTLSIAEKILQEREDRLCVTAPQGWRIIKRYVEPGQWVNGGEPLVEVGDYSRLVVPFALSVAEFRALLKQQQQGLSVSLPDHQLVLPAQLIRLSPAFDERSRKIYFELQLNEGLPVHRGGMRVELSLNIPTRSGAVLVPKQALQQRYEQYWMRRPDGSEISVVYLGRANGTDGDWVRVTSPQIKPGDRFQMIGE